jgi:hypothetical protein
MTTMAKNISYCSQCTIVFSPHHNCTSSSFTTETISSIPTSSFSSTSTAASILTSSSTSQGVIPSSWSLTTIPTVAVYSKSDAIPVTTLSTTMYTPSTSLAIASSLSPSSSSTSSTFESMHRSGNASDCIKYNHFWEIRSDRTNVTMFIRHSPNHTLTATPAVQIILNDKSYAYSDEILPNQDYNIPFAEDRPIEPNPFKIVAVPSSPTNSVYDTMTNAFVQSTRIVSDDIHESAYLLNAALVDRWRKLMLENRSRVLHPHIHAFVRVTYVYSIDGDDTNVRTKTIDVPTGYRTGITNNVQVPKNRN